MWCSLVYARLFTGNAKAKVAVRNFGGRARSRFLLTMLDTALVISMPSTSNYALSFAGFVMMSMNSTTPLQCLRASFYNARGHRCAFEVACNS